jgi:hypothetical protein
MIVTPNLVLEIWCRYWPKFAIELFGYWSEDQYPNPEYGRLIGSDKAILEVAKKMSKLSAPGILHLLRQDKSLWPFPPFPYILLQVMYDLGGEPVRRKVTEVIMMSRKAVNKTKQKEILESFKTETVVDILERLAPFERRQAVMNCDPRAVAAWLLRWDARAKESNADLQSSDLLAELPGENVFIIKSLMRSLDPWGASKTSHYEAPLAE